MLNFLKSLVDTNARELKRLSRIVTEINKQEDKARALKDIDFPKETLKLKERIANDPTQLFAVFLGHMHLLEKHRVVYLVSDILMCS